MTGRLIDISPPISSQLAVWPGDVPYEASFSLDMHRGDHLTLGSMRATFHVGAHADAPSHYLTDGDPIGRRPLELYFGDCQVVDVESAPGPRLLPEHLATAIEAPRVLFRTGTYPDPQRFDTGFLALSAALLDLLHERGVRLVGIDTPSIDPFDDKQLEAHQAAGRHDMAILESLVLRGVEVGRYTLVALPLRFEDADASPVRAALLAPA